MTFIADFHVHSKYSRATAKNLDLEHLYIAAQIKGITVVGTGDFTHPGWLSEIKEKLEPAEPGLFKLKESVSKICDDAVPRSCKAVVRFILATEISNIYKKNDRTRKNHNLVFLPDLASVEQFNNKLDAIGNLKSDGRPILGLDARNLLEILLEVTEEGFLIPAHIWTPWFSLLGSKSGFDSIKDCFDDLTPHIFAVETGLSSDPAMNRRVTDLDGITLVSNSDAHSPFNLGREANRFNTELTYTSIKSAMSTGDPKRFLGTFEFYPEKGKYHFDGHRKCNICYHPRESLAHNTVCPVCNKPLTLGVLYRVEELADRENGIKPNTAHSFDSLVPLCDILSEIYKVGPKSKKVSTNYDTAIKKLGPELKILRTLSPGELDQSGIPLLGEAIKRMRKKEIHISPGYDGEYGRVKIFDEGERRQLLGQKSLFVFPVQKLKGEKTFFRNYHQTPASSPHPHPSTAAVDQALPFEPSIDIVGSLNEEQQKAVTHEDGPLLIVAGPGTGKTLTLTHKIAYRITEKNASPKNILAVTFTNKAAQEMKERLTALLKTGTPFPLVTTFHSLCYKILADEAEKKNTPAKTVIDDVDQNLLLSEAIRQIQSSGGKISIKPDMVRNWITTAKQQILEPDNDHGDIMDQKYAGAFTQVYRIYQELLSSQGLMDYEDLIMQSVKLLENSRDAGQKYRETYRYIFVDEYQDLNHGQYRIIRALSPSGKNLCVIGDPDQSIYGFRGSDILYFNRFMTDFPDAIKITLTRNYRSTETILKGSYQIIRKQQSKTSESRVYSGIKGVETLSILASATEKSEAVAIGKTIERMVGGTGFHSFDFNKSGDLQVTMERGFSDFAILYRTQYQSHIIAEVLEKANIPYQSASRNSVFLQKGIRELMSLFKLVEGCGTFSDFERIIRIPGTGLGNKTTTSFKHWYYQQRCSLNEALSYVRRFPISSIKKTSQFKLDRLIAGLNRLKQELEYKPVEDKLQHLANTPLVLSTLNANKNSEDTLNRLLKISGDYQDASTFLTAVTLQTDTDAYDPKVEKVSLMTMHAAKGLEFPVVFIAGCEKDFIPYIRSEDNTADMEEERRLFYVAMTRAKEHLYLTWSKKRRIYGRMVERKLSPLVDEIEKRLLKYDSSSAGTKKQKGPTQQELF